VIVFDDPVTAQKVEASLLQIIKVVILSPLRVITKGEMPPPPEGLVIWEACAHFLIERVEIEIARGSAVHNPLA